METRVQILSGVGALDIDTSGYQVSDLEDIEFQWEDADSNVDPILQPSIDTPLSPSTFNVFQMGSRAKNPILVYEERDKENTFLLVQQLQSPRDQPKPLCC